MSTKTHNDRGQRIITLDEAFALIPRTGWTLHGRKQLLVQKDDPCSCPMLMIPDCHNLVLEGPAEWEPIWAAADNDRDHDPALRARLLAHCQPVEVPE